MKLSRAIALIAGVFFVAFGLWAFFAARSFYDQIATYGRYNRHLIHDIGAFQVGLGAVLLIAVAWGDSIGAALAGVGVGSVQHAAAHWWDRDLGGKSSDPYSISLLALVLVAAALVRARSRPRATTD